MSALAAIFTGMDPHTGMYPSNWTCRGCKKPLNADGHHPAELYAGTYTGLCYPCERAPHFVTKRYALDAALQLSYPPSSPSWRRDRENFYAYEDCIGCSGSGVDAASFRNFSTRRQQCASCFDRFQNHPLRARIDRRRTQLYHAAESVWQAEVTRIARSLLPKRSGKKAIATKRQELYGSPRLESIKRELLARHRRANERVNTLTVHAYAEIAPEVLGLTA